MDRLSHLQFCGASPESQLHCHVMFRFPNEITNQQSWVFASCRATFGRKSYKKLSWRFKGSAIDPPLSLIFHSNSLYGLLVNIVLRFRQHYKDIFDDKQAHWTVAAIMSKQQVYALSNKDETAIQHSIAETYRFLDPSSITVLD